MDMGPTTHFLAYFRLVLGATNTPPAPRFRPVLGKGQLGGVGEPIFGRRFLSSRNSSNLVNDFARLNNNNENKGLYFLPVSLHNALRKMATRPSCQVLASVLEHRRPHFSAGR